MLWCTFPHAFSMSKLARCIRHTVNHAHRLPFETNAVQKLTFGPLKEFALMRAAGNVSGKRPISSLPSPCSSATGSQSVYHKRYTCCNKWLASAYRQFLCTVFWVVLAYNANTKHSNTRAYSQWKNTTMILQSCSCSCHIIISCIRTILNHITRLLHKSWSWVILASL